MRYHANSGILENSVWLKEGVFGIIEPNTPLLLYR